MKELFIGDMNNLLWKRNFNPLSIECVFDKSAELTLNIPIFTYGAIGSYADNDTAVGKLFNA
jgi:hypothetical protein